MGFVSCELRFILYLLGLCQLNEMYCSALWKSHFTCFCGQLDINLSRSILTKLNCYHMSDRFVSSLHFSVELFISMVYAAEANHCVSASVKWKVPYSLLASEFFGFPTGPVEAAGNGLRHQAACLYHCNRQVGPGERASVVLMPLASSRLLLDEQSDCLLPDPPVVLCVCVNVCVHV